MAYLYSDELPNPQIARPSPLMRSFHVHPFLGVPFLPGSLDKRCLRPMVSNATSTSIIGEP